MCTGALKCTWCNGGQDKKRDGRSSLPPRGRQSRLGHGGHWGIMANPGAPCHGSFAREYGAAEDAGNSPCRHMQKPRAASAAWSRSETGLSDTSRIGRCRGQCGERGHIVAGPGERGSRASACVRGGGGRGGGGKAKRPEEGGGGGAMPRSVATEMKAAQASLESVQRCSCRGVGPALDQVAAPSRWPAAERRARVAGGSS